MHPFTGDPAITHYPPRQQRAKQSNLLVMFVRVSGVCLCAQ